MLFLQCTVVTCIPYSCFWTYLVKEGGAVHGRLFGDWWWAAAKGFGDHSIIVGHSHSTLVHFHLLFQQSTFREKENGFKEVAQRQWNLPASVLPAYKSKNTFSNNTSSNWTGQDQMLRTMNFGYVALEVKKTSCRDTYSWPDRDSYCCSSRPLPLVLSVKNTAHVKRQTNCA